MTDGVAAPLHQMVLDTLDMIEKGYRGRNRSVISLKGGGRPDDDLYRAQTLECLKKGGRVTPAAAAFRVYV